MASDLVVRLSGEDKLTPTLEKVRKELSDVGGSSNKLDNIYKKFDKIQNSTAPLNRKIKDIKKAMEEMSVSGLRATEEGEKMWKKLVKEAKSYQDQLEDINKSVKTGGKGFDLKGMGQEMSNKLGIGQAFGAITSMANPATLAITAVGGTMIAAGKAAADFEVHLDSLQALTGLTDEAMEGVSNTALDMSKKFGINAGEIADAMGLIGSQAPELLKDADALAYVTDASMTLAKAGSISAEAAGSAITTVVNQMGVLPSEAMNIANALEAAEQQGSASVEYLNKAFEKTGTQAKAAGMSYTDLAAMIETVAPKFSSADVAGSQLNSTLLKLSMGADEFNPAVVGMSQALQNLNDAQLTNEQMSKMVGEANITMLKTMMEGKSTFDDFSTSLVGTNSAVESAQIKSDNFSGAIDRLKASWNAFLITLGQSGIIQGIADNVMLVMDALNAVMDVLGDVIKSFKDFDIEGENAINPLKFQLDILVDIIKGIGIALQIVIKIAAKVFNGIKDAAFQAADWMGEKWTQLKNLLGDTAFGRLIMNTFNKIMDVVRTVTNKIKEYWNKMLDALGIEGGHFDIEQKVVVDTKIEDGTSATNTVADVQGGQITVGDNKTSGKKGSGKKSSSKSNEVKFDAGSIKYMENEISKLNEELNNKVVSDERLKEILAEKTALNEQIEALKIRNGLMNAPVEKSQIEQNRETYNKANQKVSQVKSDLSIGLITPDEAKSQLDEVSKTLQNIGLEPLHLEITVDENGNNTVIDSLEKQKEAIKKEQEELENLKSTLSSMSGPVGQSVEMFMSLRNVLNSDQANDTEKVGAALSTVGSSLQALGADGPVAKIGATMAAIGQIVLGFATASAQAATLGPFGWLAFVGAGLAAVATMVSTIQGYATGGIVDGTSYTGDKKLIRVNSGEMILNRKQQANLYKSIRDNNIGRTGSDSGGNVQFRISGRDLIGVINNQNNKTSKL